MRNVRWSFAGALAAGILVMGGTALAQDGSAQVGMTLPGGGATGAAGGSDHAAMSEHIGVGYLGKRSIPIMGGSPAAPNVGASVDAPVIGVRYWLDPSMGIDAGIGFVSTGGKTTTTAGGTSTDVDKAGVTGFLLHAGVPLSLADEGHFSFQIVPELNVGIANSTVKDPAGTGPDTKLSGFGLDIGARAGAEVHFGFMGIPQLSLQGSVGVLFSSQSRKGTIESSPEQELKDSSTIITTTVGDNPWNIFTSNVAAMYYF